MTTSTQVELLTTGIEVMELQGLLAAGIAAEGTATARLLNQPALDLSTTTGDRFDPALHAAV